MENLSFDDGMTIGAAKTDAARRRGEPGKVFDWNKAARLIVEHKPGTAEAGLEGDWDYTGGTIWRDGKPLAQDETYTYLASAWATPQLIMDDGEPIDCWIAETETEWDSGTYWPQTALDIINA